MRLPKRFLCVAICVLIAGCVDSLHALYTPQDLTFDSALLGTWDRKDGDAKETMAFTKGDDKTYDLLYTDKDGKTGNFVAHLLKIKDTTFLDLYPAEPHLAQADFYTGHLVPAHSFLRVDQIAPKLQLADMDYNWMKKFLADNPKALGNERVGDKGDDSTLVLTASTADLQTFVMAHLKDGAFSEPTEFIQTSTPGATTRP